MSSRRQPSEDRTLSDLLRAGAMTLLVSMQDEQDQRMVEQVHDLLNHLPEGDFDETKGITEGRLLFVQHDWDGACTTFDALAARFPDNALITAWRSTAHDWRAATGFWEGDTRQVRDLADQLLDSLASGARESMDIGGAVEKAAVTPDWARDSIPRLERMHEEVNSARGLLDELRAVLNQGQQHEAALTPGARRILGPDRIGAIDKIAAHVEEWIADQAAWSQTCDALAELAGAVQQGGVALVGLIVSRSDDVSRRSLRAYEAIQEPIQHARHVTDVHVDEATRALDGGLARINNCISELVGLINLARRSLSDVEPDFADLLNESIRVNGNTLTTLREIVDQTHALQSMLYGHSSPPNQPEHNPETSSRGQVSDAIIVAGHELTGDQALDAVEDYPAGTIRWYDLGGSEIQDGVFLDDLGRLAIINADLSGDDAAAFLDAGPHAPWGLVAADATLEDADPEIDGSAYDAASRLYAYFRDIPNVGPAKASKLLHLKRPSLYPILDQYVLRLYRGLARQAAAASKRQDKELYWAAIRKDLIASKPGLQQLRGKLKIGETEHSRRAAALGDLRLFDICAWTTATR
jgi:hypothetical protein